MALLKIRTHKNPAVDDVLSGLFSKGDCIVVRCRSKALTKAKCSGRTPGSFDNPKSRLDVGFSRRLRHSAEACAHGLRFKPAANPCGCGPVIEACGRRPAATGVRPQSCGRGGRPDHY